MTTDTAARLAGLSDAELADWHEFIDSHGPADAMVVEAHHLATTEMAKRGIDHGHRGDPWASAAVVVDEVTVSGPDEIQAPAGFEKAFRASLAGGGTVQVMLTVDGYVLKADPTVGDVHVDAVMPGKRRKRRTANMVAPLVDDQPDDQADVGKASGHQVPEAVQAAARQALKWIEDGRAGDGFTSVGRFRARQLADGGTVSEDVLVKMRAYFARHAVDKEAEGWGDKSAPSPGMVAWYAWGGDAGRSWANGVLGDVAKRAIPAAITDLHLNVQNRQHAIDEYLYGPMNPDAPGDYWQRLGDVWGVSAEEAATTRCHNCAAFNMTSEIQGAIADAIGDGGAAVVEAAELGYCELLAFKCAADRSCSVWLTGGPITDGSEDDAVEEEFLAALTDVDKEWYGQVAVVLDAGGDPDFVMQKAGNPEALRDYWRAGGKGKVSWGAGGDFTACVAAVGKYMTSEQAKGYCAIRHREVTGMWPGDKRNRPAKKAADEGASVTYVFNPPTVTLGGGAGGSVVTTMGAYPSAQWSIGEATPVAKHPGHPDHKARGQEVAKHLPGQHDQASHGRRGSTAVSDDMAASIIERVRQGEGLSVSMLDGSEPPSGYMVARGSTRGVKPAVVSADEFYDPARGKAVLSSFLKDNRGTLTQGDYLGLWHDRKSGQVFLDVSQNVTDRARAEALGRRRDQISIWDVVNREEIPTGGTGQVSKESDPGSQDPRHIEDDGRGDRRLRPGSLGEVRGQEVAKHLPGQHDQSSHGRRGGASGAPSASLKTPEDVPATSGRSAAAARLAGEVRARALEVEPGVTADMQRIARAVNGRMEGLDHRLKSTDSLARKIDQDAEKEHGGDREAAAVKVSDAVRYTMVIDDEGYTAGVRATLTELTDAGYTVDRVKNFWAPGDPYDGVNAKLSKDGVVVEFQIHSPSSFRTKEKTLHPIYEKYREEKDDEKRASLWQEMVTVATRDISRPAAYATLLGVGSMAIQTFETAAQAGLV